jgi:hypothetical protein
MMYIRNSYWNEVIPVQFYLDQNYPNPFRGKTSIRYSVAYKTKVIIIVINTEGDVIEKLISQEQDAGTYEIDFNADGLAEGSYFYQIIAGNYSCTKKMELIKEN